MGGDDDDEEPSDATDAGTTEEPMDSDTSDERHQPLYLGVLPWLASVVAAFRHCQPQLDVGMDVLWRGVSAGEVYSACRMLHVPRRDWPRHLSGVQYMAQVVADINNSRKPKK